MKMVKKIFFTLVILGVIFLAGSLVFISLYGKPILENQLSRIFYRPVAIREFSVMPPAGVILKGFEVPGVFQAESLSLQWICPNIFRKEWLIGEVRFRKPVMAVSRPAEGGLALGAPVEPVAGAPSLDVPAEPAAQAQRPAAPAVPAASTPYPAPGGNWGVKISRLIIQGGQIAFSDVIQNYAVTVNNFYFSGRRLSYPPQPSRIYFSFGGDVKSQDLPFSDSRAEGRGWLNWPRRDCDAELILNATDGKKILSAQGQAKDNRLSVKGRMNMSSRIFKAPASGEDFSVTDLFVASAKTLGVQMDIAFRFETLLDHFKMDKVSFSGNVGYSAEMSEKMKELQEAVTPAKETAAPAPESETAPSASPSPERPVNESLAE